MGSRVQSVGMPIVGGCTLSHTPVVAVLLIGPVWGHLARVNVELPRPRAALSEAMAESKREGQLPEIEPNTSAPGPPNGSGSKTCTHGPLNGNQD